MYAHLNNRTTRRKLVCRDLAARRHVVSFHFFAAAMKNEEYLVRATDGIKTHGTDRESGTLQETLICYRALVGDQGDCHMLELCICCAGSSTTHYCHDATGRPSWQ